MGILSNGGAGSLLLLGLLTGNEAVSGSKLGTPLIVVSIILLLSITAGLELTGVLGPWGLCGLPQDGRYEQSQDFRVVQKMEFLKTILHFFPGSVCAKGSSNSGGLLYTS